MSNKKPRILYVAEVQLPGRKASSIHVMRMCKAMAEQGYDVKLLAFRSSQYRNEAQLFEFYGVDSAFEIKTIWVPGQGRLASLILALVAILQVLMFRPTIAYTRAVVSAFALSLSAPGFVYEAHTFLYGTRRKWMLKLFNRFIKKRSFAGMVVISQALKNLYSQEGIAEKDMLVAHDGADEKPLEEKGSLKGEFSFNAGYFGSLFKGRGLEVLLKMAEGRPNIGFHIFGASPKDLNGQHKPLPNLFFYGFVSPAWVHIYRNACDVLLAPYQPEVFVSSKAAFSTSSYMSPLKIFEYMSARKSMIVSDIPVLREVLSNDTALLVPAEVPEAWIEALDRLQNDAGLRGQLQQQAYDEFLRNYTWHQRAAHIINWVTTRIRKGD